MAEKLQQHYGSDIQQKCSGSETWFAGECTTEKQTAKRTGKR
jgi:hypothetical protein